MNTSTPEIIVTFLNKIRITGITNTREIMLVDTKEQHSCPRHNSVVFFQPWQGKTDKRKKAYPVLIKSGEYLIGGRLSNFWYWQPLTPTGRPKGEVQHGYGNFTKAEGWTTELKVVVTKD